MRRIRNAGKKIPKSIPRIKRTDVVPQVIGPLPEYLRRGGVHSAKASAGTKSERRRRAIADSLA
jgi:hypothetical protein